MTVILSWEKEKFENRMKNKRKGKFFIAIILGILKLHFFSNSF